MLLAVTFAVLRQGPSLYRQTRPGTEPDFFGAAPEHLDVGSPVSARRVGVSRWTATGRVSQDPTLPVASRRGLSSIVRWVE